MNDRTDEHDPTPAETDHGPEDGIGALIRLAKEQPAAADERRSRVKAAVLEHWRLENERRSARRRSWAAGALAAAALLIIAVGLGLRERSARAPVAETMPGPAAARVEKVIGPVRVVSGSGSQGGASIPLEAGDEIAAGSELETDARGRAALLMPSGRSIRLDGGTRLRIVSGTVVVLASGAVYADSGPDAAAGGAIEVRTPKVVLREIGTQFEVRLMDERMRLRVREGSVTIDESTTRPTGERSAAGGGGQELAAPPRTEPGSLVIDAGTEVEIDGSGRLERRRFAPFGPEWSWMGEVTPVIAIEGRTAREFLEWAARERGLRLDLSAPGLSEAASDTVLTGSVEGLSVEQSLEAVLPTCRMSHRIVDGSLIIEAAKGARSPV